MNIDHKTALEIIQEIAPEQMQEGDVTSKMAAKEWGICTQAARNRLEKLVEDGILIKINGIMDGHFQCFYRADS